MELLILIIIAIIAILIIIQLISWGLRNNTPAVLLFFIVPLLAYIAYNL